jgi:hypothetical protein
LVEDCHEGDDRSGEALDTSEQHFQRFRIGEELGELLAGERGKHREEASVQRLVCEVPGVNEDEP